MPFLFLRYFKWTIGAALRGKLGVIPEFFAKGKRASFVNSQLKSRMKLLAEVESTQTLFHIVCNGF